MGVEHSSEHHGSMDGEIAGDQRCNSAGDLRGVLLVFPYPSGTGNPTCLRLSVGDSRIRPERNCYHDLFPRADPALNAQTISQRTPRTEYLLRDWAHLDRRLSERLVSKGDVIWPVLMTRLTAKKNLGE